jgi:hypothetical protein
MVGHANTRTSSQMVGVYRNGDFITYDGCGVYRTRSSTQHAEEAAAMAGYTVQGTSSHPYGTSGGIGNTS